MEKHYQPKSKGTWGREDLKEAEELNRLCGEFLAKLEVPPYWKDMGWNNVVNPSASLVPLQGDNEGGVLISVGKIFRNMQTSSFDIMHYRVFFDTYSTRGGICEKKIIDYGKYKYHTVVVNKTVEKLNEWIKEKYTSPPTPLLEERGDVENDGLQHFRDRFGNNVVDGGNLE